MNYKKIWLITLMLLAILTIGVVSASEVNDFNQTLTENVDEEVSLDASFDDEIISEESNDAIASSEDDVLTKQANSDILSDEPTVEDFNYWVSSHEYSRASWNPTIVNVNFNENVQDGSINLLIVNDDNTFRDSKNIEDADGNAISWFFDDLEEIINEPGTYTISLEYQIEDNTIPLVEDFTFKLTQLNYGILGYVYYEYPFDVMRVFIEDEEEYSIEVSIDEETFEPSSENPFRWTLNDLGINDAGEFEITVKAFNENGLVEEFTHILYTDRIYDNRIWLYTSDFGLERWEIDGPVLYLVCSDDNIGQHFNLYVDDNLVDDFNYDGAKSWSLDDLGIDQNNGYEIRLFNDEDENIAETWMDVRGIISENSFDWWISSHESLYDDENLICEVWIHDSINEGSIVLSIENSDGDTQTYEQSVEEGDYLCWELGELDILDEPGEYTINLKYVNEDMEIILEEDKSFTLTQLNYAVCDNVYIAYPFDVIRFNDEEAYIEVYVGDNEEPSQSVGEDPFRWTLESLGIEDADEYEITIKAFMDDELVETFKYTLFVDDDAYEFRAFSNQLGIEKWDLDNPVLYLVSPEEAIGETLTLRINSEDYEFEFDIEITSTLMSWTLDDLGIDHDDWYEISFTDDEDEEVANTAFDVRCIDESRIRAHIWNEEDDGVLYSDTLADIISVFLPEDTSGLLYVLVDNEVKYVTLARYHDDWEHIAQEFFNGYCWNLNELNMTGGNEYNITLVFFNGEFNETLASEMVNVVIFDNTTFRARYDGVSGEGRGVPEVFCPDNSQGTITIEIYSYDEDQVVYSETYDITPEYYNKWTGFDFEDYDFDEVDAIIFINDEEIHIEPTGRDPFEWGLDFIAVATDEVYSDDIVMWLWDVDEFEGVTVTITNGDYTFTKELSEFGVGEWIDGGFDYYVTCEDLNSFENFNDKDIITFTMESNMGKQTNTRCLEKQDDRIILHRIEDDSTDMYYLFAILFEDEEEGDTAFNISDENTDFIEAIVLENVTKAEISITSGDNVVFYRALTNLDFEFDYVYAMNIFREIYTIGDMDFTSLNDGDVVNFTLIYDDEVMVNKEYVYHIIDEDLIEFYEFSDQITAEIRWGAVGNPEYGQGETDGRLIIIDIPNHLNVTEGTIQITNDDNGEVLYSISLSDITNVEDDEGVTTYSILAEEFDYDAGMPDGVNLTFSFNYNDTQLIFGKGIRIGDDTFRHVIPEEVAEFFEITIPDRVLVNGEDNVIYIKTTNAANRQSVPIGIGGGYFAVYVNGKKIEDLGRLIRVNGETELDVSRLENDFRKLYIYLADLNITDNGIYDIKVNYELDGYGGTSGSYITNLYDNNITLTSNVKVNYENESVEWLTGYGIDPVLLYLDTYYGDINSTSGTITVSNSDGDVILSKDISKLNYADGRYSLKYSDFDNKNFGDSITVRYGDGNERNGETNLDVLWRDIEPADFNTTVVDDLDDYYGNFVNLNIPELINTGEIIVTIKFKNNHNSTISNMNVTTDFDSHAVYIFNVADIKANYENSNFVLSLSDLGFYEIDGAYDVDVKFTADGENTLNVVNKTMEVELSDEVPITINMTSRFGLSQPFAIVQIFEPTSAYADLYNDGVLYAHQKFEKGLITFVSSPDWDAGLHTAEIKVFNSEFEYLLNSSTMEFETLTQTDNVEASIENTFKEDELIYLSFNAPKMVMY